MVNSNGPHQDHDHQPLLRPLNKSITSESNHHRLSKPALTVTSINIEGFSENKSDLLSQLCQTTHCDILCVQETLRGPDHLRPHIPGMSLVLETPHAQYGSAIFVNPRILVKSAFSNNDNCIEVLTVDIGTCTITSVYKPPNVPFVFHKTTNFENQHIKTIVGDFNSHSISWGYRQSNADGHSVEEWADASELTLVHNAKLPASFNSRRWQRGYNPDLVFVSSSIKSLSSKLVCQPIPNTQHRPIMCEIHAAIKPIQVPFRPRFNFSKAKWEKYSVEVDAKLSIIEPTPSNYELFVNTIWTISRQCIPRGCRTSYIPGLDEESVKLLKKYEDLYDTNPFSEDTILAGEELLSTVGDNRKQKWITTVTNTNMTHNSKKAWSTIRRLTGDPPEPINQGHVTANQIAHQLLLNGKPPHRLPKMRRSVSIPGDNTDISKPFTLTDIIYAIKALKTGKAAGVDDLTVEQLKHLGPVAVSWLLAFFNKCLLTTNIPKLWRQTKIIAIPKPGKPLNDPKSYRPISLLCHTYKLFERLLLNRLATVVDPKLIPEQAGFRPGKSCSSQVLRLTQHIEDGYEAQKVTGVVFVDLSAAYDTINIKKLLTKVSTLTNDQGFVNILGELLHNRRFQVCLQSGKSRWRRQKNGLPQGSVLAPTLFNIYTNDQPSTQHTERFLYADDLALAAQSFSFEEVEITLTQALESLGMYYDNNALRPNPSKTQSCAFHLRYCG
ncbi:hypothetical protein PYW07_009708 [Mythimna separata]|uniref:Reverse transcriptase domain-containing protein n=1 Tax=Mythimna separata TaxID=271217 RepID=A0AAD7YC10_MYTSE|nr:hypothetical protein PYW07_009708 [Mythimna separata]